MSSRPPSQSQASLLVDAAWGLVFQPTMDELRFHSQHSSGHEAPIANPFMSPPRNGSHLPQQHPQRISLDPRSSLARRFTTDAGHVPTLSTFGALASPTRGLDSLQDYNVSCLGAMQCALPLHNFLFKARPLRERMLTDN